LPFAFAWRIIDRVASLQSALCRRLGIEYPVLSVGFGAGARAELAAAVSNAGGFGVLGASGMHPNAIRAEIERTRTLTDRPFGINVIIATDTAAYADQDREFFSAQFRAAAEAGAAAVVLFWGDPAPFLDEAHANGLEVLIQVGTVEEAEVAVAAGIDAVIAQGVEAGGHVRGTTSIWELVPRTVAAVSPVPVLASGGIGDGAGLARVLALGAQGASLGTRFVASDEAYVHPEYKRRIVSSVAEDTVYTADLYNVWWPGAPHRTLRNRTFEEWDAAGRPPPGARPGEGTSIGRRPAQSGEIVDWPRYATGMATPDFDGNINYAPLWAGESCSVVNDVKPAGEIVVELVREAQAALAKAEPRAGV
jgi:nitronate monooxygenase